MAAIETAKPESSEGTLIGGMLTLKQAAAILGVSPRTMQRIVERRHIEYIEYSQRSRRITEAALAAFIKSRTIEAVTRD